MCQTWGRGESAVTTMCYREYYDRFLILIEGHSGFGASGEDIVCAGISTISYTLLNTLLDEESAGNIKLIRNIVRDGYMCLEIECAQYAEQRLKGIIDTCIKGFFMLEESYPAYVSVK